MNIQFEHLLKTSFLLWFDHELLEQGSAYTNHNSLFYDVAESYSDKHTYGAPFKNLVADSSIAGATVMSSVFVNSVETTTGNSDFFDINYEDGQVLFDAAQTVELSGSYAVKDFSVQLTDQDEEVLLFETKFDITPMVDQTVTGLAPDAITYPAVFIRGDGGQNEPIGFGGIDSTVTYLRAIVFADSEFKRDGVISIFKDTKRKHIGILSESENPFNYYGGLTDGTYNYCNLVSGKTGSSLAYIQEVFVSRITNLPERLTKVNPEIFPVFLDFELHVHRQPHA